MYKQEVWRPTTTPDLFVQWFDDYTWRQHGIKYRVNDDGCYPAPPNVERSLTGPVFVRVIMLKDIPAPPDLSVRRAYPIDMLLWLTVLQTEPKRSQVTCAYASDAVRYAGQLRADVERTWPGSTEDAGQGRADESARGTRRRGPSRVTLVRVEKALVLWLDKDKDLQTAADLAAISRDTVQKHIPAVLNIVDEKTRSRWIQMLLALHKGHHLGEFSDPEPG